MAIDPKHIINLKGKDFILFAGLLNCGHEAGLVGVETEIMSDLSDAAEQFWVVRAVGRFHQEGTECVYAAHGDASPASSQMRGAYLRHAETRAVARMLRMATNIGMTAYEELGPDAEATAAGTGQTGDRVREQGGARRPNERVRPAESRGDRAANSAPAASAAPGEVAPLEHWCDGCGVKIEGVETKKGPVSVASIVQLSTQRWGRKLCHGCGKTRMQAEQVNVPAGQIS